jgi:hypothetical protein
MTDLNQICDEVMNGMDVFPTWGIMLAKGIRKRDEEIKRLRGLIQYAEFAPNHGDCRKILRDALAGSNGAESP